LRKESLFKKKYKREAEGKPPGRHKYEVTQRRETVIPHAPDMKGKRKLLPAQRRYRTKKKGRFHHHRSRPGKENGEGGPAPKEGAKRGHSQTRGCQVEARFSAERPLGKKGGIGGDDGGRPGYTGESCSRKKRAKSVKGKPRLGRQKEARLQSPKGFNRNWFLTKGGRNYLSIAIPLPRRGHP